MNALIDPVKFLEKIVRCKSVAPKNDGCIIRIADALTNLGFECHHLYFDDARHPPAENLYACIGKGAPHFYFAGHTDVVPADNVDDWSCDPFDLTRKGDKLYGRGTVDMKGGIAAMVAAVSGFLKTHKPGGFKGSIHIILSGSEEGFTGNGMPKILDWLKDHNKVMDHCLMCEPSSMDKLGDMIKIGRRGSIFARIDMHGVSGHSAYPQLADNPVERLMHVMTKLTEKPLDNGTELFEPTRLVVTTFDVDNAVGNVIPNVASCEFNCRFNTNFTAQTLTAHIQKVLEQSCENSQCHFTLNVDDDPDVCFITQPGLLTNILQQAIQTHTGVTPVLGTTGGTSDSRYIRKLCPVVDFGLVGDTMHKVDEHTSAKELATLATIYQDVLQHYFGL